MQQGDELGVGSRAVHTLPSAHAYGVLGRRRPGVHICLPMCSSEQGDNFNAGRHAALCCAVLRCPVQVELPAHGLAFWSAPLTLASPCEGRNTSNESVRRHHGSTIGQ